ncbi:MAG: hypothetical protein COB02_16970 [Candidatus Cloacimonadota bacterium]|nr:MAG: hypothetical protein COB02_16970 [Candidatus Cloacimonadota bacterium]
MKTLVLCIVILFSSQLNVWTNQLHLVDRLILSENYSQALFFLVNNRNHSKAVNLDFYKELLNYFIHKDIEHLKNLFSTYSELNNEQKTLLEDSLIKFYTKKNVSQEEAQVLKMNFPKSNLELTKWKKVFIKTQFENGLFEEIIKENQNIRSAEVMQYVYDSYSELSQSEIFFQKTSKIKFIKNSLKIRFIQLLLLEDKLNLAVKFFSQIKSLKTEQIGDLMIEIGDRVNDLSLVESGYNLKIKTAKNLFFATRDLAAFYFVNKREIEGRKLLFQYLSKHSNSFQYPKDVAQILVDHNQFDALVTFVSTYRKKLNFKSYMSNVLLFTYSMKSDHESFLKELVYTYGRVSGKYIAGKIIDSYPEEQWTGVLKVFKELHPKFYEVSIEITAMLAEKRIDPTINLESFIKDSSSNYLIDLAFHFYKRSNYKSALFLLKSQDTNNEKVQFTLGSSYYALGKLSKSWLYLKPLTNKKQKEVLNKVILMSKSQIIEAKQLLKIIASYKDLSTSLFVNDKKSITQIEAFCHISTLQWKNLDTLLDKEKSLFKKSDLQVIFFFKSLFLYEYKDAMNIAKAFLYIELKNPYYTLMLDMYEFLLEHSKSLKEEYFKDLIDLQRMMLSRQVKLIDETIIKLELATKNEAIYLKISPFLFYSKNQKLLINSSIEIDLAKKSDLFSKWEKSSIEMFEEFPHSHYTSWVIEQLSDYYEENRLKDKQTSLIKKYLLKFPSNLLAQRLRNKLL